MESNRPREPISENPEADQLRAVGGPAQNKTDQNSSDQDTADRQTYDFDLETDYFARRFGLE